MATSSPSTVSHEHLIEYFLGITCWNDKQKVEDFLVMCEWNIDFALDAFLPNETVDDPQQLLVNHSPPILMNSGNTSEINSILTSLVADSSPITTDSIDYSNSEKLIQIIDLNLVGKNTEIQTPWGKRKIIYADYTASGRPLLCIENYMLKEILPFYANTHSEHSACAKRTNEYREQARNIIKRCVNASEKDDVIFTGSGSTAAINKLVDVLQLRDENVREQFVVFISTYEHHSNILPWKETGVELVRITNTENDLLDEDDLERQLKSHKGKKIICTFSAASNVTGIQSNVDRISKLVHQYNGWIFWDYAAGAPYLQIDMNPSADAYKDAVFISPHKFVGGPGTPGILISKEHLFNNPIPNQCGGGTVNFVTRTKIEYIRDIEMREEGGTPNILGTIRAGFVFDLKNTVGTEFIERKERELVNAFRKRFSNNSNLKPLGSLDVPRLAIFSFLIHVPTFNLYLHHNFVCVLLNDLFGIQVRSGCSCAGPYVLELLEIDDDSAEVFTKFIAEDEKNKDDSIPKNSLMKPGFIRFNLSYFTTKEENEYILNAVEFIANHGWKFLALYKFDASNATWRPRKIFMDSPDTPLQPKNSIPLITYENGEIRQNVSNESHRLLINHFPDVMSMNCENPLEQAKLILERLPKFVYNQIGNVRHEQELNVPDEYKKFIWFLIPKDVISQLIVEYNQTRRNNGIPFAPK